MLACIDSVKIAALHYTLRCLYLCLSPLVEETNTRTHTLECFNLDNIVVGHRTSLRETERELAVALILLIVLQSAWLLLVALVCLSVPAAAYGEEGHGRWGIQGDGSSKLDKSHPGPPHPGPPGPPGSPRGESSPPS